MNFSNEYLNDYCVVEVEEVATHLPQGFIPWGSAVYDPIKQCLCQVLVDPSYGKVYNKLKSKL